MNYQNNLELEEGLKRFEFLKERLLTNGPWKMTLEKAISRTNSLKIEAEENKEKDKLEIINSLLNHFQEKKALSEL